MANAQLINRSEIPSEPAYNASDEALSPANSCPLNEEEKEPVQKIVKTYFTNLEGEPLEKITKEKEIYLVIETENMSGEEIVINLPAHYGDFKYEGEEITKDKVLKLSVSGNVEKIKLEVIPRRKKSVKSKSDGNSEDASPPPVTSDTTEEPKEEKKDRELKRIVFKRKKVLWGEIFGVEDRSGRDRYGHWWVVIDKTESYGWWPTGGVDFTGTVMGVPGSLNRDPSNKSTQDPDHRDDGDEEFSPVIDGDDPRTTDEIINCMRTFAKSYSATHPNWSYPAIGSGTGNCHTFQEEMMKHCNITRKGKITYKDPAGNVTSTEAAKGNIEEVNY